MKNTSKMSTGKLYQISVTCQLGKFKLGWGKFKLGGKEHMLFIEEDRMTFRPGYIGTRILVTQLIYWDKDTIHLYYCGAVPLASEALEETPTFTRAFF